MSWEQLVEGFKIFWSQPIPIIGFTVGTVLISALFFLAKTSFGRKSIKKANEKVESLRNEYSELKIESNKLIENLKKYYEEKLALMNDAKEKEQEIIIAIGESIHNKDVNSIVDNYKKELKGKEIVISDVVESKIDETKKQYESEFEIYRKEINELKNQYELRISEIKTEGHKVVNDSVEELINEK